MKKPELLAPAGDLEKLKIAVLYGADAVFIGGQNFSLRARSSNFTISDIKEACEFASFHNSKVYVTTNILPHEENLEDFDDYVKTLEKSGVSGVICASVKFASIASKYNLEVHISTQKSAANSMAINFYKNFGACRVVLARELSLDEIKVIRENTDMDLEVFIHGGMCSSYSGRCVLSNNFTNRDANRGGCAHSCRWHYSLHDKNQIKLNDDEEPFAFSSKDLQTIDYITDLMDIGVDSLKIEGRMKSIHYIATVVSTYRKLIDEYSLTNKIENIEYYKNEIKKAENRIASKGFFEGDITPDEQLYNMRSEKPTQSFCGLVLDYEKDSNFAIIESRNYFDVNSKLEILSPKFKTREFTIDKIIDEEGNEIKVSRHPKKIVKLFIPFQVAKYDMIRIVK